jgi:UDP-N-acetylmuramate dehydrogenase
MYDLQTDYDLTNHTLWRTRTTAKAFVQITSTTDLVGMIKDGIFAKYNKYYILGKGANTLFAQDYFDGLVVQISLKGIRKVRESKTHEYWEVASGEDWEKIVELFVQRDLGGLENLSLIPGTVGAAPIQNIGAYGVTFEDVCEQVKYVSISSDDNIAICDPKHCDFGYRNSKFKQEASAGRTDKIITSVILRLTKSGNHHIDMNYYSLSESLAEMIHGSYPGNPSILDLHQAVMKIRRSKLPDHTKVGTNGSVFVNPVVKGSKLSELILKFPKLQYYPAVKMRYLRQNMVNRAEEISPVTSYKIASGHIFDELGWKGKRVGNVGTWDRHALVVCAYDDAKSSEIYAIIMAMQKDFKDATGIQLVPEINIVL